MIPFNTDDSGLNACLTSLQKISDSVLLVPTETVYGLVCDYTSVKGREKIYQLKQRPKSKLLTIFFADVNS